MSPSTWIATTLAIASTAGVGYLLFRARRAHAASANKPQPPPPHTTTPTQAATGEPDEDAPSEPRPSTPAPGQPVPSASPSVQATPPPSKDSAAPASTPALPWWLAGLEPKPAGLEPEAGPSAAVLPARAPAAPESSKPADAVPATDALQTPLPEPRDPDIRQRINRSDQQDTVSPSPAELLAQARRYDPTITMDELTAARLAMSEHGSGTFTELAAIIDAELNRAARKGKSLFESLTHRGTFGRQNKYRPASTRRDPRMRHLLAARAVLSGKARGISRGAVRFFDPLAMDQMHRAYRAWLARGKTGKKPVIASCDAPTLLEAWSFDLGRDPKTGNRCPPNHARRGRGTLAWVGEIPGIDASRLMLLMPMPLGPEHLRRYEAARQLLQRKLRR